MCCGCPYGGIISIPVASPVMVTSTLMVNLTSDLSSPVQVKGDYLRAGEYYSRAILADLDDSELMSKYGKLVWNVHCYEERSSSYFDLVLAARIIFAWDMKEGC
ncbi:unnamed protein product [Urochloa humidicola]